MVSWLAVIIDSRTVGELSELREMSEPSDPHEMHHLQPHQNHHHNPSFLILFQHVSLVSC